MIKYFRSKKIYNNKKIKSILVAKNGWYPKEICKELLQRERHRSNRTGSSLSYVIFDLSIYSTENYVLTERDYIFFMEGMLRLLTKHTRAQDIKCFVNPYKIGILLVETPVDGAKIFIEKISETFFQYFKARDKIDFIKIIQSIQISTYPLDQMEDAEKIEGNPKVITNFSFAPQGKKIYKLQDHKRVRIKEDTELIIDWRLKAASNGSVSLEVPHYWNLSLFDLNNKIFIFTKRIIDILCSISGIILFSPVMIAIAIGIKLTSKGPILFKQRRLGYLGKREYVEKLIRGATEGINQGEDNDPVYKITNDTRITKIGQAIRNTSLDELPQFFNVLRGDMSMVGPRPPIHYEVENYRRWHLERILEAKPGITGPWQLYGRSKTTFDEMVRLDLQYVYYRNPLLDIKIIIKTFFVFFKQEGAV
jgi:lipopolysaccharide/colanic/teichoic acid biosynthesis glycosyltransferase